MEDAVKQRINELLARIARKKAENVEVLKSFRDRLAKQISYTRDTVQSRPKHASYATESEKLMGGRSGYYSRGINGWNGLSGNDELVKATDLVKKLSLDVKFGLASKSELSNAIKDLESMVSRARANLSGVDFLPDNLLCPNNLPLITGVGLISAILIKWLF